MKFAKAFMLSLAISSVIPTIAQEQLGLSLEASAGASGLAINPASNLNNPLKWDINLVGGGFFMENNFGFIKNASLLRLYQHRTDAEFVSAKQVGENTVADNVFVGDFFNDKAKRFVVVNSYLSGPSVALRIGEYHSVGVFTRMRLMGSSVKIPNQYSYYQYDERPFFERFEVPKVKGGLLNWSEIGLNYALKIPTSNGSMNFGISMKILQGYQAGYIKTLSPYQHAKIPGNAASFEHTNSRYGFAISSATGSNYLSEKTGHGLGADFGFTYIFQDHEEGYKLKLGASLLDIGRLSFDRNAEAHKLQLDSTITIDFDKYDRFDPRSELQTVAQNFSTDALGDSVATYIGNSFKMALPATLSLQADYGLSEHFYLNGLLIQRLPSFQVGPKRGNLLALTPRWQHRWLSVSIPISIYNWNRPHLGFATRLGWFVLGSDDATGIFTNKNLSGTDFYFAVKINPVKIREGKHHKRTKHKGKQQGNVRCYRF
ncbi:MAG: hypothetical protein IT258_18955 [Saprospiraceae bacterium]|nr:hypothetical protein [Saprospiraceae bacterium]